MNRIDIFKKLCAPPLKQTEGFRVRDEEVAWKPQPT